MCCHESAHARMSVEALNSLCASPARQAELLLEYALVCESASHQSSRPVEVCTRWVSLEGVVSSSHAGDACSTIWRPQTPAACEARTHVHIDISTLVRLDAPAGMQPRSCGVDRMVIIVLHAWVWPCCRCVHGVLQATARLRVRALKSATP